MAWRTYTLGPDIRFHYDMDEGFFMEDGKGLSLKPGERFTCEQTCIVPADGDYMIQFEAQEGLEFAVNGIAWNPDTVRIYGTIPVIPVPLQRGKNAIRVQLWNPQKAALSCHFHLRLVDNEGNIVRQTENLNVPECPLNPVKLRSEPDMSGFKLGTGAAFKSAGRFGFTKGDGVLDYSMPAFGLIGKPYIFGFPRYRKNRMWHFSVLPPEMKPVGSQTLTYRSSKDESIQADWNGVTWQRGDFSLNYTSFAPELLIETPHKGFHLSRLKGSMACKYIVLPLQSGLISRCDDRGIFYDAHLDGPLKENWILFYGNTEFPEIPLQIILRTVPAKITVERAADGRAESLHIHFNEPLKWIMTAFPFGFEVFDPCDFNHENLSNCISLCRKRSRTSLARIQACREYYKISGEQVEIIQKFDFRILKDEFGTQAIRCAPIPPTAVLTAQNSDFSALDKDAVSLDFPTKYGPLYAVVNSEWSSYTLSIPESRREFALDKGEKKFLMKDFDDYLSYHRNLFPIPNPGVHQFLLPYAIPLLTFNELPAEKKKVLEDLLRKNLADVLNPDFVYIGPRGLKAHPWYCRTEPHSGVSYLINYLHVFCNSQMPDFERDTVEHMLIPFIETDWGNGIALYSIYLAALFTGEWELIRSRWDIIKKAFDYFLVLMDWACMCAPYCENGHAWSDGTNYGAYVAFINMAEILEDHEARELGLYAFSKMAAERIALLASAPKYYPDYFKEAPWYSGKFFAEETSCEWHNTSYPKGIINGTYRWESLYNMTTEGHYPETFRMYAAFANDLLQEQLDSLEKSVPRSDLTAKLPDGIDSVYHSNGLYPGEQEIFSYLMLALMSGRKTPEQIIAMTAQASSNGRLSREFLGAHEFCYRRVPAAWTALYLMSFAANYQKPKLTLWFGIEITETDYPRLEITKLLPNAWMEFSSPYSLTGVLNDKSLTFTKYGSLYRCQIYSSGTLHLSTQ